MTQSTDVIKLAISEDERSYRKWTAQYFESLGGYEVRTAADPDELLGLLESWQPDVVLFDLYYRRELYWDAPTKIRRLAPNARIVALTSSSYEGDVRRALVSSGSNAFDGYLTKDLDPAALSAAVTEVMRGVRYIDPLVAGDIIRDSSRDLQPTEQIVLQGLADGLSLSEIAERLPRSAKTGLPVGQRQVRRIVESASSKLGATNMTEALSIAFRRRLIH